MSKVRYTGYKLRNSIWRALKVRSTAIQAALDRYNKVAPLMQPPAPTLDWNQIMDYTFVSEFELLKYSRSHQDITAQPWSRPVYREAMAKYFKLRRAHEEIVRVNVEARRLRTAIRDEHILYEDTIKELESADALLAAELHACYATRRRVNALHTRKLNELESLPGFTGIRGAGIRHGGLPTGRGDNDFLDTDDAARAFMTVADREQNAVIDGNLSQEENGMDRERVGDDEGDDEEDINALAVRMSEVIFDETPPVVQTLVGGVPSSMLNSWSL